MSYDEDPDIFEDNYFLEPAVARFRNDRYPGYVFATNADIVDSPSDFGQFAMDLERKGDQRIKLGKAFDCDGRELSSGFAIFVKKGFHIFARKKAMWRDGEIFDYQIERLAIVPLSQAFWPYDSHEGYCSHYPSIPTEDRKDVYDLYPKHLRKPNGYKRREY